MLWLRGFLPVHAMVGTGGVGIIDACKVIAAVFVGRVGAEHRFVRGLSGPLHPRSPVDRSSWPASPRAIQDGKGTVQSDGHSLRSVTAHALFAPAV